MIQGNDVNLDIINLSELVGNGVVCSSLLPPEQNVTEESRNLSTSLVTELHFSAVCKVAINKFNFFQPVLLVSKHSRGLKSKFLHQTQT